MTSLIALTLSTALSNAPAPQPAPAPALLTQVERIADGAALQGSRFARGGDSLTNGAVTGGLVAGVTTAVVLGYLCHVFNDSGHPICVKQVAWRTAIAVAGGAAIGAGIDAMVDHQQFGPPARPEKMKRGALSGPALRIPIRF